jgi:hypothetical protein
MLYLLIPFLLFCLGFLKLSFSIPIVLFFLWLGIRGCKHTGQERLIFSVSRRTIIITIIIVLIWVALSGIGGIAFQNSDFHTRNAIFRDLITNKWPVKYSYQALNSPQTYGLVYYIGFWLPSAVIGKLLGWQFANIALYFWAVVGILLTLLVLFSSGRSKPGYFIFLLIFFSGMDGLGILIRELIAFPNKITPNLWPPIIHLEWWIPGFQFSSFTTQLFWVFNQSIPTWLCLSLLLVATNRKSIFLTWSLCVFFAPLPALGMLPYLILKIPKELFIPENLKSNKKLLVSSESFLSRFRNDIRAILSLENLLGGGIVLCITFFYFSVNSISSRLTFMSMTIDLWIRYSFFIIFEALILWLISFGKNKDNLNWYVAGLLILIIPLFMIGTTYDFCMRASIPTIFMLMVWSAELLASPPGKMRLILILVLLVGAITPLYEINRSIYRTANYFINPPSLYQKIIGSQINIYEPKSFEYDHPYSLTADSYKSLANIDALKIPFFLAIPDNTIFFDYLAK